MTKKSSCIMVINNKYHFAAPVSKSDAILLIRKSFTAANNVTGTPKKLVKLNVTNYLYMYVLTSLFL
jgi:hypothetical protein